MVIFYSCVGLPGGRFAAFTSIVTIVWYQLVIRWRIQSLIDNPIDTKRLKDWTTHPVDWPIANNHVTMVRIVTSPCWSCSCFSESLAAWISGSLQVNGCSNDEIEYDLIYHLHCIIREMSRRKKCYEASWFSSILIFAWLILDTIFYTL